MFMPSINQELPSQRLQFIRIHTFNTEKQEAEENNTIQENIGKKTQFG
jgi:hypothetical protein